MNTLKELRVSKGLYQKDVAKVLGVDRTTYVKYENGNSEPNLDMLVAIADFFDVSTDYLLGRHERELQHTNDEKVPNTAECEMLKSYQQLDEGDKGEIRGIIKQMLRASKYGFTKEATG